MANICRHGGHLAQERPPLNLVDKLSGSLLAFGLPKYKLMRISKAGNERAQELGEVAQPPWVDGAGSLRMGADGSRARLLRQDTDGGGIPALPLICQGPSPVFADNLPGGEIKSGCRY